MKRRSTLIVLTLPAFMTNGALGQHMYWIDASSQKIQRANIDGTQVVDVVTDLFSLSALDLDPASGHLYWIDLGTIQRANLDGTNVQDLVTALGTDRLRGLAVDVKNKKLYWMAPRIDRIQRANLDGTEVEDLVIGRLRDPGEIVLDVPAGKMYWTESEQTHARIRRANMELPSGANPAHRSDIEDVFSWIEMNREPWGLALDASMQQIYWSDKRQDALFRGSYDGSNIELLVSGLPEPRGITLDLIAGKLYWVDIENDSINRVALDGSNSESLITSGLASPFDIVRDDVPEATCSGVNECSGHGYCPANDTCNCFADWTGDDCSILLCGGVNNCSGNGSCVAEDTCACDTGWTGAACSEFACDGVDDCLCHGSCVGPNECEFQDCNENCVSDQQDLINKTSKDCNENSIPDECDISSTLYEDRNENGILDICENLELPGFLGTVVAQTGDPAPGTTGTFTSLNTKPAINNRKQVAFWADSTTVEGIYLWSDGTLAPIVLENDVIASMEGTVSVVYNSFSMNDAGDVTFTAELRDGKSVGGLFHGNAKGIVPIALEGTPIPGYEATILLRASQGSTAAVLLNDGDIYFRGVIDHEPNGIGDSGAIFKYSDGEISVVVATGIDYPEIGAMSAIDEGPVASNDGTVAFRAKFGGNHAIVRLRDGMFSEVMREGDFVPEFGGCFDRGPAVTSVVGRTELYFKGDVRCMNPPASALFKSASGFTDSVSVLVRAGELSPISGTIFGNVFDPIGNPLGDIYFRAWLAGASPGSGMFRLDQRTGEIQPIILTGDPAPGAGGEFVDNVSGFGVNNIGDLVTGYRATDDEWRIVLLDQHLLGDLDLDDDVDLDDYSEFIVCENGPGGEVDPLLCAEADLNGDGDVDMEDWALMQIAFIVCEQDGVDCNGNGVGDSCELEGSIATDCDGNGTLDECEAFLKTAPDCNGNFLPDSCDIASGKSFDFDQNGMPDECQDFDDCNFNDIGDVFDIERGFSLDCDGDFVPDDCQLFDGSLRLIASFSGLDDAIVAIDPVTGSPLEILSITNPPIRGLARSCQGDLWALTTGGDLLSVNPRTGATRTIGRSPVHWIGAAYDCATSTLYGSSRFGPPFDTGLYRISTDDGSAELVGNLFSAMHGLAFDSVGRTLYSMASFGTLWSIDPDTAARSSQCDNLPISNASGLSFADGLLYAANGHNLFSIDPATCAVQPLGDAGTAFTGAGGLAALRGTTDCNANDVPDNCDIDSGHSQDSNTDGVPDECDAPDCNLNGVSDDQELSMLVTLQTPQLTPFGDGFPQAFTFPAPPQAFANPTFTFTAQADLDASNERVTLQLNGSAGIGNVYNSNSGGHCVETTFPVERTMPTDVFNSAVDGADATITLTATSTVDPFACADDSWISVAVHYFVSNDCNNNAILDECESPTDCNDNGVQDICDIARGTSQDCNENGVLDDCDLTDGTSVDCEPNGIPDDCEPDCNRNGASDECDIADGTSQDCNTNSVLDECDIADATSFDGNQDGVPDECAGTLDPDMTFEFLLVHDPAGSAPAINNRGSVVYRAEGDVRLLTNEGVTIKARSGTEHLLLNDAEQVVVMTNQRNFGIWEILRIEPEQTALDVDDFIVIADSTNAPFGSLRFLGGLANNGAVAFEADGDFIARSTFVGDGTGQTHDVNSFHQPFPTTLFPETGGNRRPAMNNVGLVVQCTEVNDSEAIVGLIGPVPSNPTIDDYIIFNRWADTGYLVSGEIFVNDANNVAFGNRGGLGEVLLANGTRVLVLARDPSNALSTTVLSMNNHNEVVFQRQNSSLPFARTELVITDGKTEVVVLRSGDVIGDHTVFSVTCSPKAYNDARQVAILVQYRTPSNDIKHAAYIANPVP